MINNDHVQKIKLYTSVGYYMGCAGHLPFLPALLRQVFPDFVLAEHFPDGVALFSTAGVAQFPLLLIIIRWLIGWDICGRKWFSIRHM